MLTSVHNDPYTINNRYTMKLWCRILMGFLLMNGSLSSAIEFHFVRKWKREMFSKFHPNQTINHMQIMQQGFVVYMLHIMLLKLLGLEELDEPTPLSPPILFVIFQQVLRRGLFSNSLLTTTLSNHNGNISRLTGSLWWESTGHQWIPLTKANGADLWCFLWSAPDRFRRKLNNSLSPMKFD